jgi:hypothetical protein
MAVSPTGEWGITTFMQAWNVYLVVLNPDGSRTAPVVALESYNGAGEPYIAHDGTTWVTAWYTSKSASAGYNKTLWVNRGSTLNTPYSVYSETVSNSAGPGGFVRLLPADGVLSVAWTHASTTSKASDYRLRRFKLPTTGSTLTPITNTALILETENIPAPSTAALVATGKSSMLGLWGDNRWGVAELYARAVDLSGCP